MKKVQRSEILDLGAYEEIRERFMRRIREMKKARRVHVGNHMTFIFENHDTVLFQIQEMLRVERITQEKAIQHELDTYNTMVPGDGELFATLMVEYEDREERHRMLDQLTDLKKYLRLRIGEREVYGQFETLPGEREDRLPAVNYIRFVVGKETAETLRDESSPTELIVDHPAYEGRTSLPSATRQQLADDLEEA
jgi:hypothetical protein